MHFSNNTLFLAPMAGITETVFRRLCRTCGADVAVSEMASAEGVLRSKKQTLRLLAFDESERPIGVQLFGSDPERLADAAAWIQAEVRPDYIDLNSGCPVPKVVSRNGGAALLRDPVRFERIVAAMARAISIPLTVKLRSGYVTGEWVDEEFARIAEANGAAAIALHPRSKAMRYSGTAIWERIALVKKAVAIPVIGNGDICSPADAVRMKTETGCDCLMVGRGALGNPWLFSAIKAVLAGEPPIRVTNEERLRIAQGHIAAFRAIHGERRAAKEMRKHCAWYLRGLKNAAVYRDRVFRCPDTGTLELILRDALMQI